MQDRAPYCLAQRTLGIAVPTIGSSAKAESFGSQQRANFYHELIQPLTLRAGPRRTEQTVQMLIPGFIYVCLRVLFDPSRLAVFPWQSAANSDWVNRERAHKPHDLLRARLTRFSIGCHRLAGAPAPSSGTSPSPLDFINRCSHSRRTHCHLFSTL